MLIDTYDSLFYSTSMWASALDRVLTMGQKRAFCETKSILENVWRVSSQGVKLAPRQSSKFTSTGTFNSLYTLLFTYIIIFVCRSRRGMKREIIQITQCACV